MIIIYKKLLIFVALIIIYKSATAQLDTSKTHQNKSKNTINYLITAKLEKGEKPNRLITEKSPHLLQHAFNPIDWFPWGEEAFEKARAEDKPIFLSIGYSSSHWCHVMNREVFENKEIAELLNEKLICIKVDREERPDIDRLYMSATQAITGSGGWPLSVFLTPDLKPFFAGTYIPLKSEYTTLGFHQIVKRISNLWKYDRKSLIESSDQVIDYLKLNTKFDKSSKIDVTILEKAYRRILDTYDSKYSGFGEAPKFPRPSLLNFLIRYYLRTKSDSALQMVTTTLQEMQKGGIYDHIGGGFHRYSVDKEWRLPQFEKMLYDQAQLICSYIEAYQLTKDENFANTANDILDYVFRVFANSEGGFYSSEDAESIVDTSEPEIKKEGAFYLWTQKEIEQNLDPLEAIVAKLHYGIEENGNITYDPLNLFTGKNILYTATSVESISEKLNKSISEISQIITNIRLKLFQSRELRPHPHLDDKILTAWNALMISACARAYQVFENPKYLSMAERSAKFILKNLYNPETKQLFRRFRDGEAKFEGTLQDYSFFVMALLDLYESTFDINWFKLAVELNEQQMNIFWDKQNGGFFETKCNDSTLILLIKDVYDGDEPTGNSISATNLIRIAQMSGNTRLKELAESTILSFSSHIQKFPDALPQMLIALDWLTSTPTEIVIAGEQENPETKNLIRTIYHNFIPKKVMILVDHTQEQLIQCFPFLENMKKIDGKPTAYICHNYDCKLSTSDQETLIKQLFEVINQ